MGAVTYPDAQVSTFIKNNFIPVQINVVEHPEFTDRFLARWTPTIIFLDSDGREHRRTVGYKLPQDFLAELRMGLAQEALDNKRYEEAIGRFQSIVDDLPDSLAAPEAMYMAGVSRYRATDDPSHLGDAGEALAESYPNSEWAKAGEVWLG